MSDVIQGDLADERPVDDRPLRFLPPAIAQDLTASVEELLLFARARGLTSATVAARVVTFIAPLLVDKDVQLAQTAAALSALVDEANRLAEISGRRAMQLHRLREELHLALGRRLRPNQIRVSLDVDTPTIVEWATDRAREKAAEELSNWCDHVRDSFTSVDELLEQMEVRLAQLRAGDAPGDDNAYAESRSDGVS